MKRTLGVVVAVILMAPSAAHASGARLTVKGAAVPPTASTFTTSPLTLTDAQGRSVGGAWQRWVDEARVAVWSGDVTLDTSNSDINTTCGQDDGGCFWEATSSAMVSPDRGGKDGLYHELGHLFDAKVLTDADRAKFMRLWHVIVPAGESTWDAWWAGEDHADPLSSGPPGEWFAEGYRLCATYGAWTWQTAFDEDWYQYGYPAQDAWGVNGRSAKWAWTVRAQRATCRLIDAAR